MIALLVVEQTTPISTRNYQIRILALLQIQSQSQGYKNLLMERGVAAISGANRFWVIKLGMTCSRWLIRRNQGGGDTFIYR
tara:strand:- start:46364 stop:46606 length:243 start_codon:yes stop_codon:yes gene_type:complete